MPYARSLLLESNTVRSESDVLLSKARALPAVRPAWFPTGALHVRRLLFMFCILSSRLKHLMLYEYRWTPFLPVPADPALLSSLFALLPASRSDDAARSALFSVLLHISTLNNVSRQCTAVEDDSTHSGPLSVIGADSETVWEGRGEPCGEGNGGEGGQGRGGGEGGQTSSPPPVPASTSSAIVLEVCDRSQLLIEDLEERWGEAVRRSESAAEAVEDGDRKDDCGDGRGSSRHSMAPELTREEQNAAQKEIDVVRT